MNLCRAVLLLLVGATHALAQLTYTAKKIVFSDPGSYTQVQLEDAVGMHAGTKFKADDLGDAAQKLIDTGYFGDVGATLEGMTNAANVLFSTKPVDRAQMLHVGFENFLWLTHEDIKSTIHAKSPLFADYLPESSPLNDVIKAKLTTALAAKGIEAQVAYETVEPTMLQPERVIEFRIVKPSLRVAAVKLEGVDAQLALLIQKSVNVVTRSTYSAGLAGETTEERILEPLRDAGYLQATLENLVAIPAAAVDEVVPVTLTAKLKPGEIFHVASLQFAGTPLMSSDAFAAAQKLHSGDVASRKVLLETLAPLDAAYRRQGYMDVVIKTSPKIDAASHQVAYTVAVEPGQQYRIHQVTAKGLNADAQNDFDRGWLMKEGELYNPEYVTNFVKNNTALQALSSYSGGYKAYANPNTHTVDLVISFIRAGR